MKDRLTKNEIHSLRGRQVALVNKYISALQEKNESLLGELKEKFVENLQSEIKLIDYFGVEVGRYPIFFDNILHALGFRVRMGDMPTVSGTQPYDPYHIALDASRILILGDDPSRLFGSIADIQPLTTKPVLGISFTTWTSRKFTRDNWEHDRFKLSIALGIGRLQINDPELISLGIKLDPKNDVDKLIEIAQKIGLTSFLSLSIDNLPIYGTFRSKERELLFQEKNVKKLLLESQKEGHELVNGTITQITPKDALKNPNLLLEELNQKEYLSVTDQISITKIGKKYVESNISFTPQEAALFKIAEVAILEPLKKEFRLIEEHIIKSEQNITNSLDYIKFAVKEVSKNKYSMKYVIEAPPISPIKIKLEIPIGGMTEEEIIQKIVEIKTKVSSIPNYIKKELKNSILNLPKIPLKIKNKLLNGFD